MGRKRNKAQPRRLHRSEKPPNQIPHAIAPQQQTDGGSNAGGNMSPASIIVPISPQGPQSPTTKDEARERRAECRDQRRLRVEIGTLVVGLAGVVGLLSNLSLTREANRISREALTSVERAYVSLKIIQAHYVPDAQGNVATWHFQGEWENSGTTPTQTLRQHVNYALRDEPFPDDYGFPDNEVRRNTISFIAPEASAFSGPISISPDDLRKVQAGEKHLYFWGWVAYRDVFQNSETHLSEFCSKVSAVNGDVVGGERDTHRLHSVPLSQLRR